jgi:hypothetical protein
VPLLYVVRGGEVRASVLTRPGAFGADFFLFFSLSFPFFFSFFALCQHEKNLNAAFSYLTSSEGCPGVNQADCPR